MEAVYTKDKEYVFPQSNKIIGNDPAVKPPPNRPRTVGTESLYDALPSGHNTRRILNLTALSGSYRGRSGTPLGWAAPSQQRLGELASAWLDHLDDVLFSFFHDDHAESRARPSLSDQSLER
jgi:hypothetical protein